MATYFDKITQTNSSEQTEEVSQPETTKENKQSIHTSQIKLVTQELIKTGVIDSQHKSKYQICLHNSQEINSILAPLDLQMRIDDVRGLAFILVNKTHQELSDDEWRHPLVRKRRLNLEQSLMVAILRKHYLASEQEAGIGNINVIVHLDDLLHQLNQFLQASGSDMTDNKRLRNLLEQLKSYNIVSDIDESEKVKIYPLIVHLLNPENLMSLIGTLKEKLSEDNAS